MEKVEPHLFVVFGATGDLSRRKLLPAFHRLMKDRLGESVVLGVAGSVLTDEEFRARSLKALVEAGVSDEDAQRWCGRALHYQPIGEGFDALVERIEKIEKDESLPGNRVFYSGTSARGVRRDGDTARRVRPEQSSRLGTDRGREAVR